MGALRNLGLKIKPVDVGQLDIEDETGGDVRLIGGHILARRPECYRFYAVRCEQFADRFANPLVVIDDKDNLIPRCSLRLSRLQRQIKDELRSARLVLLHPQASAVGSHDGAADGETHSHTGVLRRVKGLEHPVGVLDAGTGVADFHLNRSVDAAHAQADDLLAVAPSMASRALRMRLLKAC